MHFENEIEEYLTKNDEEILAKKCEELMCLEKRKERNFGGYVNNLIRPGVEKRTKKGGFGQTQWTRVYDSVQEHFSSHVNIGGLPQKIPLGIHALKVSAKQGWVLYKKRECERRKRARVKVEQIKQKKTDECKTSESRTFNEEKQQKLETAKIMMMVVEMCENCRKMYVMVNLFWGVSLCDLCYFSPEVIHSIMTSKIENTNKYFSYFDADSSDSIQNIGLDETQNEKSNIVEPHHSRLSFFRTLTPPSPSSNPITPPTDESDHSQNNYGESEKAWLEDFSLFAAANHTTSYDLCESVILDTLDVFDKKMKEDLPKITMAPQESNNFNLAKYK